MNSRRDYFFYGLFVVLTLVSVVPLVMRNSQPLIHTKSDAWPKLTASKTSCNIDTKRLKMRCSIAYTPEVQALNGKQIGVDGFMLPLESTQKFSHFLLSFRSPSCPYCPPGAANEIVEVFTKSPMTWSDQLTSMRGTLTLADAKNDNGIFYQLKDAEPGVVESDAAAPAPAIAAATKPVTEYHFTELSGDAPHETTLAPWAGKKLLTVFWRADCAPCLKELELLPALAKRNADLSILLISLQDEAHTKAHLPAMPQNVHVFVAKDDGREVLTAFGNDRMLALPYSVMLDAKAAPCGKHYGIVSADHIQQWRKQCM